MTEHQRFLGVDFSGAVDAGRKIWIAEAFVVPAGDATKALAIQDVRSVAARSGGAKARQKAMAALVDCLGQAQDAVVGIDAPFSLPVECLGQQPNWMDWLAAFPQRYATAEAFQASIRAACHGREPRRACDRRAKTPFSPINLRLYRQTYHMLRDVLHPLVVGGRAAAVPFMPPTAGQVVLAETCPASFLKANGLARPYKGGSKAHSRAREDLVNHLESMNILVSPGQSEVMRKNSDGDALDAVICAASLFLCAQADPTGWAAPKGPVDRIEGRVYF